MKTFLRKHILALVVAALVLPQLAGGVSTRRYVALERGVASQVNAYRAAHGLPRLHTSAELRAAADTHSRELANHGYFAHPSPDGSAFWKRVARFYPLGTSRFWSVGENLFWSSDSDSAAFVIGRWDGSPEHRDVLQSTKWREMGVSAIQAHAAPGYFGGRDVVIVTVDFGVRR